MRKKREKKKRQAASSGAADWVTSQKSYESNEACDEWRGWQFRTCSEISPLYRRRLFLISPRALLQLDFNFFFSFSLFCLLPVFLFFYFKLSFETKKKKNNPHTRDLLKIKPRVKRNHYPSDVLPKWPITAGADVWLSSRLCEPEPRGRAPPSPASLHRAGGCAASVFILRR